MTLGFNVDSSEIFANQGRDCLNIAREAWNEGEVLWVWLLWRLRGVVSTSLKIQTLRKSVETLKRKSCEVEFEMGVLKIESSPAVRKGISRRK